MAFRDRTRTFAGRHRRLLIGGGAVVTSVLLLVAGANAWVVIRGDAPTFSDAEAAPHAETAIVLGAYVEPDGQMSTMLSDRVKRALYLAGAAGLEARGVTSDLHTYGEQGLKSSIREVASRVKAVGDIVFGSDVIGGPDVPITGKASESRVPAPPSGTPAAGAPNG